MIPVVSVELGGARRLRFEALAPELIAQCEQALDKAHDDFLVAAAHCREANGRESWIAGAIRHHLAQETVWNTLDERYGVEWHEFECQCQSSE